MKENTTNAPQQNKPEPINKPLTRAQIKALPSAKQWFEVNKKGHLELVTGFNGFTPTSIGITGQQLKRAGASKYPHTNRKSTKGRVKQLIPIYKRDENGKLPVDAAGNEIRIQVGIKEVWHKRLDRELNV